MENRFKFRVRNKETGLIEKLEVGACFFISQDGILYKKYYPPTSASGEFIIIIANWCFAEFCTGQPDKNKIMDYEGNLLKDEFSTIYETVWNNKNSCFDFEIVKFGIEPKFYRDSYCADNLANMEIIGNKFEHSHLLKGGE